MSIKLNADRKEELVRLLDRLMGLIEKHPVSSYGLSFGRSGLSLLYFYYGAAFEKPEYARKGYTLLAEIFDNLNAGAEGDMKTMDYYSGLTGVVTVLNNLAKEGHIDFDFSDLDWLDELIYNWAIKGLEENNTDFFYGAVGPLSYFTARLPDEQVLKHIEGIGKKLDDCFVKDDGIFAIVNEFYNRADKRKEKEINFGIVHGMSSVILNIINLHSAGYENGALKMLAEKSVQYILDCSEKHQAAFPYCFASSVGFDPQVITHQRILGWCFSDMNIIHFLGKGRGLFNNEEWEREARRGLHCAMERKSTEQAMIQDPNICHGSAGLAVYFHTLSELYPDVDLSDIYDHWLKYTVDYFKEKDDSFFYSETFTKTSDVHSFFYGPLGVALCLIAIINPQYSGWKKIILL